MTQEHPINPPPKLVEQWDAEAPLQRLPDQIYVATQARWPGAVVEVA